MKFVSTRGLKNLSFKSVALSGFAEDGGLPLPECVPVVDDATFSAWKKLSYAELCVEVFALFVDEAEVSRAEWRAIVDEAFGAARTRFEAPEIVRLAPLSARLSVLELFHGPTLAFKDLGLQVLGALFAHWRAQLAILVATSGDTGSSAIEAVRGRPGLSITVLYPLGRVSRVQELQMTTVDDDNVCVLGVEGTSDDCDAPLAALFADAPFASAQRLCTINSINWVRIMVQAVHFIYAYVQLADVNDSAERVTVSVPSGAAGNATAGAIARQMGARIDVAVSVNANDTLDRLLRTGELRVATRVHRTPAPSMDIAVPYNVERVLYMALAGDAARVTRLITQAFGAARASVQLSADELARVRGVGGFASHVTRDVDAAIRACYDAFDHYVLDPHTAVAFDHAQQHLSSSSSSSRVCVLASAHPLKFAPTIARALGDDALRSLPVPRSLAALEAAAASRACAPCDTLRAADQGAQWTKTVAEYVKRLNENH